MGLYPDLLPTDYRKQLQYPNPLPGLSGAELEKAHLALIDYLTQVSAPLLGFRAGLFSSSMLCWLSSKILQEAVHLLQLCYVSLNGLSSWLENVATAPE